jgi:hypothetical protein
VLAISSEFGESGKQRILLSLTTLVIVALCSVNVRSESPIVSDDTETVLFAYCGKAEHFDSVGCIKYLV